MPRFSYRAESQHEEKKEEAHREEGRRAWQQSRADGDESRCQNCANIVHLPASRCHTSAASVRVAVGLCLHLCVCVRLTEEGREHEEGVDGGAGDDVGGVGHRDRPSQMPVAAARTTEQNEQRETCRAAG